MFEYEKKVQEVRVRIGSRRGTLVKTRRMNGLSCLWGAESCLGGCSLLLKAPSPGSCSWHHLYLYKLNNHGGKKDRKKSAGLSRAPLSPVPPARLLVWCCSSPQCSTCLRELLNWCQRCGNQVSPVPVLPGGGFQSLWGSQEHEESVASFSTGFSTLGPGLSLRRVLVERSGRGLGLHKDGEKSPEC